METIDKFMIKQKNLGPLERQIMDLVWQHQSLSVRQTLELLNNLGCVVAYTTVMTIMSRLLDKGFLIRQKKGKQFVYKTTQSKSLAIKSMIGQMMNSFVERFGQDAVVAFLEEADKLKKPNKTNV